MDSANMPTTFLTGTRYALRRIARQSLIALGLYERSLALYFELERWRNPPRHYPSETSKARSRLAPYCTGYGVDLGFGGDAISEHAIRVDLPRPYTYVGSQSVQLGGDARDLYWFCNGVLDFVYSSHLLEDYEDTEGALREWLRVLKPGGRLIILCPDEQRFREHCRTTGQPYNPYHKQEHFSLEHVKTVLRRLGQDRFIHENPVVDIYAWELVCEKR
jgi:predicted SAM-dependent methyltransferase